MSGPSSRNSISSQGRPQTRQSLGLPEPLKRRKSVAALSEPEFFDIPDSEIFASRSDSFYDAIAQPFDIMSGKFDDNEIQNSSIEKKLHEMFDKVQNTPQFKPEYSLFAKSKLKQKEKLNNPLFFKSVVEQNKKKKPPAPTKAELKLEERRAKWDQLRQLQQEKQVKLKQKSAQSLEKIEEEPVKLPAKEYPPPQYVFPSPLHFKNCVPGQVYKQTVRVVNPHTVRCRFHLKIVNDSVTPFIDIDSTDSPYLPPGLKWSFEVVFFVPQNFKDQMETKLIIFDDTGKDYTLPIIASVREGHFWIEVNNRRSSIVPHLPNAIGNETESEITSAIIEYGKLKQGQISKKPIRFFNKTVDEVTVNLSFEKKLPVFQTNESSVTLRPHQVLDVWVSFTDGNQGKCSDTLNIFKDNVKVYQVTVSGDSLGDLISVSKKQLQIGNYMIGSNFLGTFNIKNKTNQLVHYEFSLNLEKISLEEVADSAFTNIQTFTNGSNSAYRGRRGSLRNLFSLDKLQSILEINPVAGMLSRDADLEVAVKFSRRLKPKQQNINFKIPLRVRWKQDNITGETEIELDGSICRNDFYVSNSSTFDVLISEKTPFYLGKTEALKGTQTIPLYVYNPSLVSRICNIKSSGCKVESGFEIPAKSHAVINVEFENIVTGDNVGDISIGKGEFEQKFQLKLEGYDAPLILSRKEIAFHPIPLTLTKTEVFDLIFNNRKDPKGDFEYQFALGQPKVISSIVEEGLEEKEDAAPWSFVDEGLKLPVKLFPKSGLVGRSGQVSVKVSSTPYLPNVAAALQDISASTLELDETSDLKKTKQPAKVEQKAKESGKPGKKDTSKDQQQNDPKALEKSLYFARSRLEMFRDTCVTMLVPCQVKRIPAYHIRMQKMLEGETSELPKEESAVESLELKLKIPIVRPSFYLLDDKDLFAKGPVKLDFGPITVNQESTITLACKILSKFDFNFTSVNGGANNIELVNTSVTRGQSDLKFKIAPNQIGSFEYEYELSAPFTSSKLIFTGNSFNPVVEIERKRINFDYTIKGETSQKTFTVKNTSPVPLALDIKLQSSSVFVVPQENMEVPANSTIDIPITFKPPMTVNNAFKETLVVKTLNQTFELVLIAKSVANTGVLTGIELDEPGLENQATEFEIIENFWNNGQKTDKTFKTYQYCQFVCKDSNELNILNLKPVQKIENLQKKQSTALNFTIEPFKQAFSNLDGRFIFREQEDVKPNHQLEPLTGQVEIGTLKKISVKSISIGESFFKITLTNCYKVVEPRGMSEDPIVFIVRIE